MTYARAEPDVRNKEFQFAGCYFAFLKKMPYDKIVVLTSSVGLYCRKYRSVNTAGPHFDIFRTVNK